MTAQSVFGEYIVDFDDGWYVLFNGVDEWQALAESSLEATAVAEWHYLTKLKSLNI